ncbi:MAG: hypothetical protein LBN19_01850 [Endomicrobium sp.]|jgi:hypothetical protein|nr:hypothetical protein [Endomicrobium sp.]
MEEVKILDGQSRAMKTLVMLTAVVLFALSLNSCKSKEDKNGDGSKVADRDTVTPIPMTLEKKASKMKQIVDWAWYARVDLDNRLISNIDTELTMVSDGRDCMMGLGYNVEFAQKHMDIANEMFETIMNAKTRIKTWADATEVLARTKVADTDDASPYVAAIENDRAIMVKIDNDVKRSLDRLQVRVNAAKAKLAQEKSKLKG